MCNNFILIWSKLLGIFGKFENGVFLSKKKKLKIKERGLEIMIIVVVE